VKETDLIYEGIATGRGLSNFIQGDKETDLIYEGIATNGAPPIITRHPGSKETDLIYEGIATGVVCLISFREIERN